MKRRTKLEIVRQVVEEKQYIKIKMLVGTKARSVILDYTTASRILNLFTKSPLANLDKINALSWDRLVSMAYSPLNEEYAA
jgi:hypothetical protein